MISHILAGAELDPTEKVSGVKVPEEVPETSGVTGYAFSDRLLKITGMKQIEIPDSVIAGKERFQYAELAQAIALDGTGSPALNENWIRIWINDQRSSAGSKADYIWLYFARTKKIKLWGLQRQEFPKGAVITWNLNHNKSFLEDEVNTDDWDELTLVNPSGDGIKIDRIQIAHSRRKQEDIDLSVDNELILDWECQTWLDGSKLEKHGFLGLTAKILETKLAKIDNSWEPQLHWAAREIGKTDHTKYGTGTVWCSEFASWCLRKALWDTPVGDIGSGNMQDYFESIGRKYTKAQLLDGTYELVKGDYLKFPNHSALFIEYLGDPKDPNTKMKTIDGNVSATVGIRTHKISSLVSVGCTR
jgi:hypothetical protein